MNAFPSACVAVLVALASSSASAQTPEELLQRLKDPDATTRRLAAEALGKQKVAAAIPALVELLKEKDASVRRAAEQALANFGAKAAPALAGALSFPEEGSRLAALRVLAELKEDAKEARTAIQAALKDKAVDVRIHAAHALGRQGADSKEALPALFEAAKDTANLGAILRPTLPSSVTEAAIDAALAIDPKCTEALAKAALPALLEGLKAKDVGTVQGTIFALTKLGTHAKAALPALENARKTASGFAEDGLGRAIASIGGDALKPLLDTLKNKDASRDQRLRALSDIGFNRTADDRIAPALLAALADDEPEVRAGAVDAITWLKPKSKEIVAALLERLDDTKLEDAAQKQFRQTPVVANALARFGSDAVPGLADILKDEDKKPLARWHAARALVAIGRKSRTVLSVLEAGMKDRILPIAIESACAYALAGGEIGKSLTVLEEGLAHKTEFVIGSSAHAIARLGTRAKSTVPQLVKLLDHKDREVRIAAARALGVMGADAGPAVPAMGKLLKDGDGRERYQIGDALEKLGPVAADAVPALVEHLKDLGSSYPNRTLVTLGKIGPGAKAAVPALIELLKSPRGRSHENTVLETLGKIGPDAADAVPAILERLDDKSEFTRGHAAQALGSIGPKAKTAVPKLRDRTTDEATKVRVWAAYALARIANDAKTQVPVFVELWKEDKVAGTFGGGVRYDVAQALELLGPDAASGRDILLDAVSDKKTPLGTLAHSARALGRMTGEAAVIVPKLIALLERPRDGDFDSHRLAPVAEALGLLGPKAKAALPQLRKLLDDDNLETSTAAETAIRNIEGK